MDFLVGTQVVPYTYLVVVCCQCKVLVRKFCLVAPSKAIFIYLPTRKILECPNLSLITADFVPYPGCAEHAQVVCGDSDALKMG